MQNLKHAHEDARAGARTVWIDHTSEVAASPDTLYRLLADIDAWPSWTPGLKAIKRRGRGPIRVGEYFVMVLKPKGAPTVLVPCKLFALEPNFIEWGGGFGSGVIRHSFAWEPLADGRTRVRQLEYATGWLGLLTRPIAGFAHRHDLAWSHALERRFA
jgi:hypothetical protein